jgi:hypothetical protein
MRSVVMVVLVAVLVAVVMGGCMAEDQDVADNVASQVSAVEDPGAPAPDQGDDQQVDWRNYCERGFDRCMQGPSDFLTFCVLGTGGVGAATCYDAYQDASVGCYVDLSNCHLGGMGGIPLQQPEPDTVE